MKKFISLIFVIVFAFVLVGCGGGSGTGPTVQVSIAVNGDSVVYVGKTAQYTAEVTPADTADKAVAWSTTDEAALTIDENGLATGKAAKTTVYVVATLKADENIKTRKKVSVKIEGSGDGDDSEYPDLQGYTIKIAQAETALHEFDPFLAGYKSADKDFKQQAWRDVEEMFSCTIEVVAYPSSAEWGPSRWNYILTQAQMQTADYDFYTVPDDQIAQFVEGGALINVSDFYDLHGDNMMDPSFYTSGSYQGKLYAVSNSENNVYSVMYYNVGLYETLKEVDPTLEEPAQIFLNGEWTHTKFLSYCQQVQAAMAKKYGALGTANDETQEYYAVSGWDAYWWAGLASNDGEPIADINEMKINMDTPHKAQAAEIVKQLYNGSGLADPAQSVDQGVESWNLGKAFFNTGDLWFVNADNRWSSNMWGEDTRYGYVPWPRAVDVKHENIKIAMGGTATWVMPIGRDYSGYGDDCKPENIYWAIAKYLQLAKQYYQEDETYDRDAALANVAAKFAHSEASQEAYIYIQNLIEAGAGYFDPMCNAQNPVGGLYTNSTTRTTVKGAVSQYCTTGAVTTWEEAIINLVPVLQESLRKAFS